MKIEIFNVEHGQCSVITLPNGKKIMVDAGHNATNPWRPSRHFYGQDIELLVISNFDEDHTSDLFNLFQNCKINAILVNPSINSSILATLKPKGMRQGIKTVHEWMQKNELYKNLSLSSAVQVNLGDIGVHYYYTAYPHLTDTNNLSLATFIKYGEFSILFPGDLEVSGWESLMNLQDFRNDLAGVTVLMASHHGRDNGCCDSVFNWNNQILCNPQCTIISDGGIQHATQDTRNWYKNRTQGCLTTNSKQRWVISTCNDGHIKIDVGTNGSWNIETNYEPFSGVGGLLGLGSLASVRL